jgi:hypothetical protein
LLHGGCVDILRVRIFFTLNQIFSRVIISLTLFRVIELLIGLDKPLAGVDRLSLTAHFIGLIMREYLMMNDSLTSSLWMWYIIIRQDSRLAFVIDERIPCLFVQSHNDSVWQLCYLVILRTELIHK